MIYALIDPKRNVISFIKQLPRWLDAEYQQTLGVQVLHDVKLDPIPTDLNIWPDGEVRPETVVCSYRENPDHFRVFKYSKEIDKRRFLPSGRTYGGVYRIPLFLPKPEEPAAARRSGNWWRCRAPGCMVQNKAWRGYWRDR